MITGNFALLAGVDPKLVHQWYLEVYADAYEWVELPNVVGMSQFADGGFLGTKPYRHLVVRSEAPHDGLQ